MAAVTHSALVASTTDGTSFTTGAFTPVEGDLLVLLSGCAGTVATGTATASANGITFTKVISAISNTSAHTGYLFVADQLVPASPVSMTCTMDVTGDTSTGACVAVASVSGMTKTGLTAIKQSAKTENQPNSTPPTVTFGAACDTANPTIMQVQIVSTAGLTNTPAGWTERADQNIPTPTWGVQYCSRDSGFTGTTITYSSNTTAHGTLAVELDASADAAVSFVIRRGPNYRR